MRLINFQILFQVRWLKTLIAIFCLSWTGALFAEPPNFYTFQQSLLKYYKSGNYLREFTAVTNKAKTTLIKKLQRRDPNKKYALVLDIDETALSNIKLIFQAYNIVYQVGDKVPMSMLADLENPFNDPALQPIFDLYQYALRHDVTVFFLTGRYDSDRAGTVKNLTEAGYTTWKALIMRNPQQHDESAVQFKTNARKEITNQGYEIIMNIGDQQSDLTGGYADYTFKLPNPFYYVP